MVRRERPRTRIRPRAGGAQLAWRRRSNLKRLAEFIKSSISRIAARLPLQLDLRACLSPPSAQLVHRLHRERTRFRSPIARIVRRSSPRPSPARRAPARPPRAMSPTVSPAPSARPSGPPSAAKEKAPIWWSNASFFIGMHVLAVVGVVKLSPWRDLDLRTFWYETTWPCGASTHARFPQDVHRQLAASHVWHHHRLPSLLVPPRLCRELPPPLCPRRHGLSRLSGLNQVCPPSPPLRHALANPLRPGGGFSDTDFTIDSPTRTLTRASLVAAAQCTG